MWNQISSRCALALCALFVGATASQQEDRDQRIVGGTTASTHDAPYIAAILKNRDNFLKHICGGSVISSRHILSAAHCFYKKLDRFSARMGSKYNHRGGVVITVQTITIHPEYDQASFDADIAILKLTEQIPLNDKFSIRKANLPYLQIENGQNMTVFGWGLTKVPKMSHQLRKVNVPIVDWEVCHARFADQDVLITSNMFCAGCLTVGGIDACSGDSGGPIAKNGTVYGIVSFGIGCGERLFPGVYTDVAKFVPWIQSHIDI